MAKNRSAKIIAARLLLACLFFSFGESCFGQEKDSLWLYKKIKRAAYKYKLTKMAYDAVFIDPEPKEYPVQPASKEEKRVNPYLKFRGQIIRKINIEVMDPFGYSVNDTIRKNINGSQKLGNHFHITTRKFIIGNRLLFKENDSLSALRISESERILREQVYVNDARIYISETSNKDSVDVFVVVLDKWPITIPIMVTDVTSDARFRNKNLLGLGQQFEQYAAYKRPDIFEFSGIYNISNLGNTFISSQMAYQNSSSGTSASMSFDRPFFSPLVKWAGGLGFSHQWRKYSYLDSIEGRTKTVPLNIFGYDVWTGRNIKIKSKKALFQQSSNILMAFRFYNYIHLNRPSFDIDYLRGNVNSSAFIGNFGFAIQQYYKDKFIHRFGANEDVPEGLICQFIYGGIKREFSKIRYYTGMEIARAKHFSFGYLSATFSYGIFYNVKVPNDVTTNYQLYYFSDLLRKGRWFFRQFINYNLVHGENKMLGETITLRGDELYGFSPGTLTGNTKMVMNSETVAYMPYNLIGFRFAPVIMVGLGMLGDHENPIGNSRLYQGYSLGVMVRNENLLASTFQISVGMYPFLPDGRNNVFSYNPVTSFTLRVRAFSVSKPDFVAY